MHNNGKVLLNANPRKIHDNLIERAKKLSSSLLCDAMGSFEGMDCRIKPISPGMKVVGTAVTVKIKPGDNLFLHKAIYSSGKGFVLVVDSNGYKSGAVWGEMMTRSAIAMGLEGVVLDGVVRDLAVLREMRFPIFACGAIPNGVSKNSPGLINCSITCGGVSVSPGDLVLGDDDGVVIVPSEIIENVITLAEDIMKSEEKRIKEIEQGKLEPDWVDYNISKLK